jgi:tetratricopeptide (TPR) repeat protein
MEAENKSEAELIMEEASTLAEAGHYLEAAQLYRKAMDAFPPLNEERMNKAFSGLCVSHGRAKMALSLLAEEEQKSADFELVKIFARMSLHSAYMDPLQETKKTLSFVKKAMNDLKNKGENPTEHSDLFMIYAEMQLLAGDFPNAEKNFTKAVNYGGDKKKIYYTLMSAYAVLSMYSGGARENALRYCEAYRQAAQGDEAALKYAWPLAQWLQSARDEPPPAPPRL